MKLDIILINYNSDKSLLHCINSILDSSDINIENIKITVVDNGSVDHSIQEISHIKAVQIFMNKTNLGYGKACNIGFQNTSNDYILLLNPDTLLPKTTISESLKYIDNNSDIDLLGVKQLDVDNKIQKGCCRKPGLLNALNTTLGLNKINPFIFKSYKMVEWDHNSSGIMFHVIGSFWLFKRDLLEVIGNFDEDFFLYYEDLDFSARLHKAGKQVYYNSDIYIQHEGGGASKKDISKRLFYSLKNRNLYFRKHFNTFSYLIVSIAMFIFEPIIRMLMSFVTFNFGRMRYTIKGYVLILKSILK